MFHGMFKLQSATHPMQREWGTDPASVSRAAPGTLRGLQHRLIRSPTRVDEDQVVAKVGVDCGTRATLSSSQGARARKRGCDAKVGECTALRTWTIDAPRLFPERNHVKLPHHLATREVAEVAAARAALAIRALSRDPGKLLRVVPNLLRGCGVDTRP